MNKIKNKNKKPSPTKSSKLRSSRSDYEDWANSNGQSKERRLWEDFFDDMPTDYQTCLESRQYLKD